MRRDGRWRAGRRGSNLSPHLALGLACVVLFWVGFFGWGIGFGWIWFQGEFSRGGGFGVLFRGDGLEGDGGRVGDLLSQRVVDGVGFFSFLVWALGTVWADDDDYERVVFI